MRSLRPSVVGGLLVASALIALLAMLPNVPVPVRAVAIVGFALVCPGLAWVRLLGVQDRLAEWTLGIATSIAIATLVASLQAYAGAWSRGAPSCCSPSSSSQPLRASISLPRTSRRHDELGHH